MNPLSFSPCLSTQGFKSSIPSLAFLEEKNEVMSTLELFDINNLKNIHVNPVILHWFNRNGTHFHHHYPQSPPVNEQK